MSRKMNAMFIKKIDVIVYPLLMIQMIQQLLSFVLNDDFLNIINEASLYILYTLYTLIVNEALSDGISM